MNKLLEKLSTITLQALREDNEVFKSIYQSKLDNASDKIKEIDRILSERNNGNK